MKTLLTLLLAAPLCYLLLSAIYQFTLAMASKFKPKAMKRFSSHLNRFLVLVPAYKEDAIIKYSTQKNMQMTIEYPRDKFDLVVIADQLESSTRKELKSLGAKVHEVSFEKSTKVKSLKSAVAAYSSGYDAVIVLDADNVMEKGFLFKANGLFNAGARTLQGLRKAANENTSTALMDGLSEAANTEMLCKGANRLGLSSKLSGSAMVFDYELFQTTINQCQAIGGFDKEMELLLTQENEFIHYSEELVVLDQKVTDTAAFARQRSRWLEAQYTFFKKSIRPALKALAKGNIDFFHKVVQLALPPRAVAPFAILMLTFAGWLFNLPAIMLSGLLAFSALIGSYLLVLPFSALINQASKIALSIPKITWAALLALKNIKRSKKEFIHTKHELIEG